MSHPSQLLTTFPPPPLFANNPINNLINSPAIPPACFAEMVSFFSKKKSDSFSQKFKLFSELLLVWVSLSDMRQGRDKVCKFNYVFVQCQHYTNAGKLWQKKAIFTSWCIIICLVGCIEYFFLFFFFLKCSQVDMSTPTIMEYEIEILKIKKRLQSSMYNAIFDWPSVIGSDVNINEADTKFLWIFRSSRFRWKIVLLKIVFFSSRFHWLIAINDLKSNN